ncbi:MAG: hypothetical protein M3347_05595, partial [Armatimonadota bacterium]|nr:hypothetical protein [Armatimonadota bacterium]
MANTVLARTNPAISPNGSATTNLPSPKPLAQMHDCLKGARQLEAMAVESDRVIRERLDKLAQAAKEHKERASAVENAHKARLTAAGQERVSAKTQVQEQASKFHALAKSTVERTNSLLSKKSPSENSTRVDSRSVPPESASNLADRLKGVDTTVT